MKSSLDAGKKYIENLKAKSEESSDVLIAEPELIVVMHFPPVSKISSFSGFQQLFEDYDIKHVIYGHIHGEEGFKNAIKGNYHGVHYDLISCDHLNCKPMPVERSRKSETE